MCPGEATEVERPELGPWSVVHIWDGLVRVLQPLLGSHRIHHDLDTQTLQDFARRHSRHGSPAVSKGPSDGGGVLWGQRRSPELKKPGQPGFWNPAGNDFKDPRCRMAELLPSDGRIRSNELGGWNNEKHTFR